MIRILIGLFAMAFLATPGRSQERSMATVEKFMSQWSVLVGEWTNEPSAAAGTGYCAFRFELGGHLLIRTNHAELTASGNRPRGIHDDVMVIYPDAGEHNARATYWDNEGHTIEYSASWSVDGNTLTFVSKPGPGPEFRLTYKKESGDELTVSFEIAPPGQPGAFKPYTSGHIRRKK